MLTFRFLRKSWKVGELNVLQTLKTIPFLHTGKTQTTIKYYRKKSFFSFSTFKLCKRKVTIKAILMQWTEIFPLPLQF